MTGEECLKILPREIRDMLKRNVIEQRGEHSFESSLTNEFDNVGDYIDLSMYWCNTYEGQDFWNELHKEYIDVTKSRRFLEPFNFMCE